MVHYYVPQMQGSGIEALTIAFDHSPVGPHFTDRGYNAIQFTGRAAITCAAAPLGSAGWLRSCAAT